MIDLFQRPYFIEASFNAQAKKALWFGVFVFLFLSLFQPFQLNTYPHNLWFLTGGYGVICVLIMLFLNHFVPRYFPVYFDEENWNVGKHIVWTTVNIGVVGLGNAFFSKLMGVGHFNFSGILLLEFFTFSLAIFPVAAGVLWNESRLSKKFESDSVHVNEAMAEKTAATVGYKSAETDLPELKIPSENIGEDFTIHPKSLLFVKAAENYAEVFYVENKSTKKKVIRASLKSLEDAWRDSPELFRCHKSYIANLQRVHHLSGNAQGLKLHITNHSEPIPVSRQLNKIIKEKLETSV